MTKDKYEMEAILDAREKMYGKFVEQARISQDLKKLFFRHKENANNANLATYQIEALEMIFHKLARLANGDVNIEDTWRDIAGYATLAADELHKEF